MIWSVETDDFLGNCHGMKYPLLTAINSVLFDGVIPPTTAPPPPSNTTTRPPTTTTPTPPGGGTNPSCPTTDPSKLCTQGGYVGDPCDLQVFYQCIQYTGGFRAYRFECADGLVFDPSLNVCNWPYNVPN